MSASAELLVSVLTPVYNGEDFLAECIESVLRQTFKNFEYVIVNNCSTDRSLEIALRYAARDRRIRVHSNTSFVGVIENHNIAFSLISPAVRYCKVVSADDLIFAECIARMVEVAEANPSVGIVGSYQLGGNAVNWQGFPYPRVVMSGSEICGKIFLEGQPLFGFGTPTSLLYRADLVRGSEGFYPNSSPHADTSACFEHLQHSAFGFVYRVLSYQRIHKATQSATSTAINRYASAYLSDLIHYGPSYLSRDEVERLVKARLGEYHRFLAVNLIPFRGKDFWDYHRRRLEELGYPLTPAQLLKAAVVTILREALNPEQAIRKVWRRFPPGATEALVQAGQPSPAAARHARGPTMKPLVSILIPAFNAQQWIADAIDSAVSQTWPRKEIIVVDDGSHDHTLSIARRFASAQVSVVTQANQGPSATRNQAFSICQGDYIQWLDADDLLAPDKIARQMDAADRSASKRTLLSSAWGRFMYRLDSAKFTPTPLWCDLTPVEWLIRKVSLNLHMQTATWLVSRELTEAAGPWDTRMLVNNDGEYFCRVLLACDGVRFVPGARVFYRMTGYDRVSYIGRSQPKMEALFLAMQLHIAYIRSLEDSERVRAACVRYLQDWLINFYPERPDIVKEAQQLAATLGGRLEAPHLSWKYAWIQKSVGWPLAKRALMLTPRCKWSVIRSWDRALSRFESCERRSSDKS